MPRADQHSSGRAPVPSRIGRPPLALAGALEERLLDAANEVFLEHGFAGATLEQIAQRARAGKSTLYARYAGKEALFAAVIRRTVDQALQPWAEVADDLPPPERVRRMMQDILTRLLTDPAVSLVRMVIAAAPQFPVLAQRVDEYGRQRTVASLARIFAATPGFAAGPPGGRLTGIAAGPEDLARLFLDMMFPPLMLNALIGEDLAGVRAEIPVRIDQAVALFRAAGLL